ncbi:MAG: MOSC domain-containing protein [Sulfurospirillum sp.]|nr:MAG: MOSC domain-containing protein [Sulfurospirillum sp.]
MDCEKELSVGSAVGLFVSKKPVDEMMLDHQGVVNDKFYNKARERSVLLSAEQSYALAKEKGISLGAGELGENILLDYNPYHLTPGAQIRIGEVTLEITQNCTLCKSLSKIDSKLPKLLKDDRGIFARVVKEGIIKKGDQVYIIKERK